MKNKLLSAILIAVCSFSLLVQAGEMTLDKGIFVTETNIEAIMNQGSREFFGDHPVTDEFLFYVAHEYGQDVLKKIVENKDYSDPKVWYMITGKSIHQNPFFIFANTKIIFRLFKQRNVWWTVVSSYFGFVFIYCFKEECKD